MPGERAAAIPGRTRAVRHTDDVSRHARTNTPHHTAAGSRLSDATPAARAFVIAAVALAVVAAPFVKSDGGLGQGVDEPLVAAVILACSILSVEAGWLVEGRTRVEQRPHKALSVWAFAVVLAIHPAWLLLIVPATYAHVYWRGLRPPIWKWVGSAAFVTLAALAASQALRLDPTTVSIDADRQALFSLLISILAFLIVESLLFGVISSVNHPEQEVWLRATLASPVFYLTEFGLLSVGALSVVVLSQSPWFGVFFVPVFGFVQQAVVFEPLRIEATTDTKTGLLRYEAWRSLSALERERMKREGSPWAVLFVDLDHFGDYNETHGHLGGDEALVRTADVLRQNIRKPDLVCRFGGEEFAILLVEASQREAEQVAERLRVAIGTMSGPPLTVSVGVAAADSSGHGTIELAEALALADRAVYDAKRGGRNTVVTKSVASQRTS